MRKAGCLICLICLLAHSNAFAQVELRSLSPNRFAENVPGQTTLRWSVAGPNLIVNGSFERGPIEQRTEGWIVPFDAAAWPNPRSYDGTNMLQISSGVVAQQITLPQTTSAIMWTFGMSGPLGPFTAQVQTPAGEVLKREDFSKQGRRNSSWRGAVDITEFAGQTVRLAFDFPRGASFSYYLDDVRVEVFPEGIEFDVYGLDSQLRWLGRTRGGAWPVPELAPNRGYTWRVDAVFNNQTNVGPVLTFKTKASSHPWDLEFVRVPEIVCPDRPLRLEMIVRDTNGFALSSPSGVEVLAAAENAPAPQIVITELNVSTNAEIEFANVSEATVDLSRWEVEAVGPVSSTTIVKLPPGATLAPGEVFTLRQNEIDGVWPRMRLSNLNWGASNASAGVILRSTNSQIVDCAFVDRRATNTPGWGANAWFTVWPIDWRGPVLTNINAGLTYQRIGDSDANDSTSWTGGPPNIGMLNPALRHPFSPGFGRAPMTFKNVPWSLPVSWEIFVPTTRTAVVLPAGLSNAYFIARRSYFTGSEGGPYYVWAESSRFQVPDSRPCITLIGEFAENDGRAPLRVVLGAPAKADVTVKLSASPLAVYPRTGHYPQLIDDEVTVRAGESEALVYLDFTDNATLEGPRRFLMTAMAAGHGDAWAEFTVRDDERPHLTLIAPDVVREGEVKQITIVSSIAPIWEMTLNVRTEPPSGIAGTVKLNGETNRAEIIVGGYDLILQGNGRMKVFVEALDWTPARAEFDYVDATTGSLNLGWPLLRMTEGGTARLTYSMGAKPLTSRYGTITSSRPDLLPSPGQVSFTPENGGSGAVDLTPLPTGGPDRVEVVELVLSAEGMTPVKSFVEIVIEAEDTGQIVSAELAADRQTLVINFTSRPDWKYMLGRATNINGPWTLDRPNARPGTGAEMQVSAYRASDPNPAFYRIFREPPSN